MARSAAGRSDDALADFARVSELVPDSLEALVNAGVIHLRDDNFLDALDHFERADRLRPGMIAVMRSLANALTGLGRFDESATWHERVESMDDADAVSLTDFGFTLLSGGRFEEAGIRFERALQIAPHDQTALAGRYLVTNEGGLMDEAQWLMDYRRLLYGTERIFNDDELGDLRVASLGHPDLAWEPSGRSTRLGRQTPMLNGAYGSPFHRVFTGLQAFVEDRIDVLRRDKDLSRHPWVAGLPAHWRLQAWCTVLSEDGCQNPHIHPAGWMSGVLYVDSGDGMDDAAGQLVFGHAPSRLSLNARPIEWTHSPNTGQLISFPSYFFHHTKPYSGTRPRISLAFDVVPTL